MAQVLIKIIAALTAAVALNAQTLQIISVSRQGEVSRIRQLVAKFDEAAVNFGDPKAPAPLTLNCSDAPAAKGEGRWICAREWVFKFENDLPSGVSCSVTPVLGFKSASGAMLAGASSYLFNSIQDLIGIWPPLPCAGTPPRRPAPRRATPPTKAPG